MPVNYDLNIIKGSTFSARVIASNADGSAVDLTNYQTRGYVKQRYSDAGVLLDLKPTPTAGYELSGYIDILVPSSGTEVLPVTQAVYDIEMYGPTGSEDFVIKLLDGRVNIYPEVTNPQSTIIQYSTSSTAASSAGGGTTPPPMTTTTTTQAPSMTTTTTTTTTATPGGGGGGGGSAASITITAPTAGAYSSLPFDLTVSLSNAHHWHWIDGESSQNGFDNYSVGADITNVGTMVSAGTLTYSITENDLPGGANWGPANYIYVVAVDANHQILANSNGAIATDAKFITLV